MPANLFDQLGVLKYSKTSILDSHVENFAMLLLDKGYARYTIKFKVRQLSKLGHWLGIHKIHVDGLNEEIIDRYLESRISDSKSTGQLSTYYDFLEYLRDENLICSDSTIRLETPLEKEKQDFSNYLSTERNLVKSTINRYTSLIVPFLENCFDGEDINFDKITVDHINKYILKHSKRASLGHTKLIVTALRSFFTYLYSREKIAINLALSVPKVAFWRLSSLPKSLKPGQVEKMLKSCDLNTNIGQRDYAVLLLLARLGLRACEIVSMRLEDINWESGIILVRGKGSREDHLPIPQDVGEAIAQYLKNVRPKCSVRNVFVRVVAPYQGFSSSVAIRDIVDNALTRANIPSVRRGAHLLRHSLATRMLQDGASLTEIGEVLRHNSQTTTEIYAKVDLKALHSLAQPWPVFGGVI